MAKKKKASKARSPSRQVTLRLDAAFYPKAALQKAAEAFAHLADIQIRRQGKQQVIRFGRMSAAAARKLPDEFANYALSCAVVQE